MAETMRFVKMHGTGNDFVVLASPPQEADWPEWARRICDRHFGVGADGLIFAQPSATADLRMRMFNPDGSEAEMCGNGIRCFTKFVLESGQIDKRRTPLKVEMSAGLITVWPRWADGRVTHVRVGMGQPRFAPRQMPVSLPGALGSSKGPVLDYPLDVGGHRLKLTFVSMGNPHAVHFLEGEEAFPLLEVGPQVERHPLFPRRTNFEVVRLAGEGRLRAWVWERGAGPTLACGTGACAVMAAAHVKGIVGQKARVEMPGGPLAVEWDGRGEVFLTGPAETVYEGVLRPEALGLKAHA